MAQIAASGVTYTLVSEFAGPSDPRPERIFTISFGDGTAEYTNGGIPLTKAKLGCPETIQSLTIIGSAGGTAAGNIAVYNYTAATIRLFQDANITAGAASHLTEMLTSAAVPATTLQVKVIGY